MTYQTVNTDVTSDDKLWALLSYLFSPIIPLVVLLMDDKKNRPFIRYHAIQALGLAVVYIITLIIIIGVCLSPIYVILMIYYAIKAYQGEYFIVPVLTDFMKNQHWL